MRSRTGRGIAPPNFSLNRMGINPLGALNDTLRALSQALLSGPWTREALEDRAMRALVGGPPSPALLAAHLTARFGEGHAPHPRRLRSAIAEDPAFQAIWSRRGSTPVKVRFISDSPVMEEPPPYLDQPLPQIPTTGDLARWLHLGHGELEWLADTWGKHGYHDQGPLHHYRYQWRPRAGAPPRLIEIPKSRLKRVQRRILREILQLVPPHSAAHGFRQGRSCLSYVQPHVDHPVVARMDLKNFFQSINQRRITGLFRGLGYPFETAYTLTCLCTHGVPGILLRRSEPPLEWERRLQLQTPHLPQGAPSSPALANLCAYRLDCRLAGLAQKLQLSYTRYADDLAFSGDASLAQGFERLHLLVARIALEEGFELNTRKSRLMRRSGRQRLTGIVLNRHPNLQRGDYDCLKATLHNCVRFGPAGQNHHGHADFRAHLTGLVAYVKYLNPQRGAKLGELLERIDWEA